MKILLIRLQILLILLLVFSPILYLSFRQLSPQIRLIRYDLTNPINSTLSPLHTASTQILDAHNNPIVLRGVNLISTNWGEKYESWNPEAIRVAAQDWHINVIRTRVYQHEYESSPANFFLNLEQQILAPARENGLYVILHPWFGDNQSLPDSIGIKMWLNIAKRYKDDSSIIYDLLAEPRDATFSELKNTYSSLIPQIRAISPNSLIMVTGLDWGRDINAWLSDPLPYPNLVYRTNPYNKTSEFPGYFGRIAEKYPVFLGEFGSDNKLTMTQKDVQNILAYANELNLGWTAWHFTSTGCPCLLSDESTFSPSSYGEIVKTALQQPKNSTPFTLPTFDTDPNKLIVYTDFLDSGFTDYSWGTANTLGVTIQTKLDPGDGFYLNTSRHINPRDYNSFYFTLTSTAPEKLVLRFKSHDNLLSTSYPLTNGQNEIKLSGTNLDSISGIIIEPNSESPTSSVLNLDNIYFQK